jgi:queuine tRNA-ribosyltransferase
MMVVLDDPRPNDVVEQEMEASVERTIRWARRSREEYDRQLVSRGRTDGNRPLLFSVVQGGTSVVVRKQCAQALIEIGFDGYGFGGRHVDADGDFLEDIVRETAAAIPEESPRFALGIGTPEDIIRCHAFGWDMFDCVIPTREGRHGRLFLWSKQPEFQMKSSFYSTINITNEQFREDFSPVDEHCDCELCKNYSRAYLRHLFRVEDPLAGRLATLHNLRFYARLLSVLRGDTHN